MGISLQEQLDNVKADLSVLDNNNRGDLAEISRLTTLQNELLAQEALEARVQVQEERVESITLPYNFSEIFDDPRADAMIIELIKDLQRQSYAEHNAEIEQLVAEQKAQVAELKSENNKHLHELESLSNVLAGKNREIDEVNSENTQLKIERDDAYSKRDAAVSRAEGLETLLAEKQEHIDKLREEIAIGAKAAVNVTNISPSDRLAALVEESKQAKVKSALDIALENKTPFRGKVGSVSEGGAQLNALEAAVFPYVNPTSNTTSQLDTAGATSVPTEDQGVTFQENVHSGYPVDQGCTSEDGKTLEEAFRRIEALEAKLGVSQ